MPEEFKFEVKDRHGRPVRLRVSVYDKHIVKHPEMADYLDEIQDAIRDPDWELDDEGTTVFVSLGLGRDEFEKLFISIPVYYAGGRGEVATFHFKKGVGRGDIVWRKPRT